MSIKKNRETRGERLKRNAFMSVLNEDKSMRQAAEQYRVARSTFHSQFKQFTSSSVLPTNGRRPSLLPHEENCVVRTLQRFATRGFPLTPHDLSDCIELLCRSMSAERRSALPFKNERPGLKFLKNFEKRHKAEIRFNKASKQENKRFASTNGENLTTFFAELDTVLRVHNIDATRIANLDESGVSPDKDGIGSSKKKQYGLRSAPVQQCLPKFTYRDRITIMPVIFASGECWNPLFVFKGSTTPYRVVHVNGKEQIETVEDCLPRGSIIKRREKNGGVDKGIFIEWVKEFVTGLANLTTGGKKVLLLYDAYRSHMSLEALTVLEKGNVIAFAILAHTSGTTQPLDVGVFQPWKANIDKCLQSICSHSVSNVFDIFDLCKVLRQAYFISFNGDIIQKSFAKAGIWPYDPSNLLSVPRPLSEDAVFKTLCPEELEIMLEEKKAQCRDGIGVAPVILKRGYLSTKQGLILTSEEAMGKIRKKEAAEKKKNEEKYRKAVLSDAKFTVMSRQRRNERELFEKQRVSRHVRLYGEPYIVPRSMKLRRIYAAEQAVMRKASRFGKESLSFSQICLHPGYNPSCDQFELEY